MLENSFKKQICDTQTLLSLLFLLPHPIPTITTLPSNWNIVLQHPNKVFINSAFETAIFKFLPYFQLSWDRENICISFIRLTRLIPYSVLKVIIWMKITYLWRWFSCPSNIPYLVWFAVICVCSIYLSFDIICTLGFMLTIYWLVHWLMIKRIGQYMYISKDKKILVRNLYIWFNIFFNEDLPNSHLFDY